MEQCRLCPGRDYRAFVLCPAKSRRLRSLHRKIMEQCRLCSAKLWRHSFRGQKLSLNLIVFSFHQLGPLGRVSLVVAISVPLSVCLLSMSLSHAIFFEIPLNTEITLITNSLGLLFWTYTFDIYV